MKDVMPKPYQTRVMSTSKISKLLKNMAVETADISIILYSLLWYGIYLINHINH